MSGSKPEPGSAPRRAYRIVTPRLVLRCWNPSDAPLVVRAIEESLSELRSWMAWAKHEPEDVSAKVEHLRRWRGLFDTDQDFVYGIFSPDETLVLGGSGLHTRGEKPAVGHDAREIGYWIHSDHTNRGLATEVAGALTRVGFENDRVQRIEIHCDPRNARSAAIPRKLGYRHEATLRQRMLDPEGQPRDTMLWTMLPEEYPGSPASTIEVEAFDVIGERLL